MPRLDEIQSILRRDLVPYEHRDDASHPRERLLLTIPLDVHSPALHAVAIEELREGAETSGVGSVQISTVFPVVVPSQTVGAVLRLLLLANQRLEFPGLGYDESSGVLFYRFVLLLGPQAIDENLLRYALGAVGVVLQSFTQPLRRVADGQADVDTALDLFLSAHR